MKIIHLFNQLKNNSVSKSVVVAVCCFLTCLAVGCSNSVNQDNFAKIQKGMTKTQVYHILGNPTQEQDTKLGGISGTSATWQSGKKTLLVVFINNEVMIATFKNDTNSDQSPDDQTEHHGNANHQTAADGTSS